MNVSPKLSIIVPLYNVEDYIDRCLLSIINQLTEEVEVLIINDGSTDSSQQKASKYVSHNIKVYSKTNGGLSSARNYGLNIARGEYIWFVDSDDYISESAIKNILNNINNYNNIEVFSYCFKQGRIIKPHNFDNIIITNTEYLEKVDSFYTHSFVYNHSFLLEKKLLFSELRNLEDYEFNLRVLALCARVMCSNFVIYHYIIRENSISTNREPSHMIKLSTESVKAYALISNFCNKNHDIPHPIIKQKLFHSINGLAFSWLRFSYPYAHVKEQIQELRSIGLYPTKKTTNRKSNLFALIFNSTFLFYIILFINSAFKKTRF